MLIYVAICYQTTAICLQTYTSIMHVNGTIELLRNRNSLNLLFLHALVIIMFIFRIMIYFMTLSYCMLFTDYKYICTWANISLNFDMNLPFLDQNAPYVSLISMIVILKE